MIDLDQWIDNKIVQNVFIWSCLFLILLGTVQAENKVLTVLVIIVMIAPSVYISNLLILPYFRKHIPTFFILSLLNALCFTAVAVVILSYALEQTPQWKMFFNLFGVILLALTFGTALKMARDSFVRRQEEKTAELKLLKAQLNPHFLFNTLNNLYGLSVLKSDKLPELMLKLSDLLRYSLYDTKEQFVSLDKEIQYLENYISLERIRLEDQTEITFKVNGEPGDKVIAPMLLIVFVENAFKHLGSAPGIKSRVEVRLSLRDNMLDFSCINTTDNSRKETSLEKGKSGIGLANAKKRLSFLYPNTHELNVEQDKMMHHIGLKIRF
ncbi:hypothetical protein EJ994_04555 [Maribacter sp. MJ134]|uniref:sensor histidine kinase n=1 Tax=Maribacter sp. MJ134 TaxID=2496865 RepID=UPI000F83D906|nr:histidine kinase [Maribacter sp. MJ134]AZQ58113.1 hypothetical protein EJ994_04555 [Maribacter sp. MJ134]